MGIMIDNSGIVFEGLALVIPKGLDLLTDIVSIIPVAGSVAGTIGVVVTLTERPLTYLIEHGSDLIGLYFNVQRKTMGSCLFKHARGYTDLLHSRMLLLQICIH